MVGLSKPEAPATSVEGDGLEPDRSGKVRDRPGADAQAVNAAGAEGAKESVDGAGNAESGRQKEVVVAWSRYLEMTGLKTIGKPLVRVCSSIEIFRYIFLAAQLVGWNDGHLWVAPGEADPYPTLSARN